MARRSSIGRGSHNTGPLLFSMSFPLNASSLNPQAFDSPPEASEPGRVGITPGPAHYDLRRHNLANQIECGKACAIPPGHRVIRRIHSARS